MKEKVKSDLLLYQKAHTNQWNQVLHYLAFLAAFLAWIFLLINWRVTVVLAILHYVFSWIGHFYFEKNKPASFRYPLVGFYAGFSWFFLKTFELISGKKILPK